jgi:hypothetical protein
MPDEYSNIKYTPIHEKLKTIFPIVLKYKMNTIEKIDSKLIFNLGDSNTTVNFFSGTGLNTGISNVKKILLDYRNDLDIRKLNKKYEIKNRRTIYNSLLSSQNPSFLSPIRLFFSDTENIGPFEKNITDKEIEDINKYIERILKLKNNKIQMIHHTRDVASKRAKNLIRLLDEFDSFFDYFFVKEFSTIKSIDYGKIHKSLKWNLFVCIYNLYLENPILGSKDFNQESINYLNNIIFNYFDFCNFAYGSDRENNKEYFCDIIGDGAYDPRRSEGHLKSANFTT